MLGIIGGSGVYGLDGLEITAEHDIATPFGAPSAPVAEGKYHGTKILFLARHGTNHSFLPHEVNYRANIFALKKLGANRVVGLSAVGSLREDIKPGELALAEQYFDHTRGKRDYSFFGSGIIGHVSTAMPVCPALGGDIVAAAKTAGEKIHTGCTYACVEGPRLGTKAESFFLRDAAGAHLVGMTNVPEVFLAREAQLAYATICLVTDYDCWMDDPDQHVSVDKFLEVYGATVAKALNVLGALLKNSLTETPAEITGSLATSLLTPDSAIDDSAREWLDVLRA